MTRFSPPVRNREQERVIADVNVCIYVYIAHASTGGPRVIRCFPRPTDRQHLLQVHTLEIESTYDARPRETTFNAPFLHSPCTCSFLPSFSVFLFYRDCIVVHEKKSEKPMGSERESFENLSRIYENKSFSEKINIWISMKGNFLFEEFTKINHVIHKKFQKSIYFPTRDSFPQKFSSLSSRLNCRGNTR